MDKIRLKKYYPVIFLTIVIAIASAFMITTEKVTLAVLESRQDPETMALLQEIFPEADFYTYSVDREIFTIYDNNREKIGYAVYGEGQGFSFYRKIVVLVGLKDKETIKNIIVISHDETPSFWNELIRKNFLNRFIELKIEKCYLSSYKNPDGVDAIAGATYSSEGIVDAVRDAVLEKIQYLD